MNSTKDFEFGMNVRHPSGAEEAVIRKNSFRVQNIGLG